MPIIDPGDDLKIESNSMEPAGGWIWMAKITLSPTQVMRLARNTVDLTFLSETWRAFPFEVGDIKESSDGELTTMTLTVADVDGGIAKIVRQNDGLSDAEVVVYRVPAALFLMPTDGGGRRNYLAWLTTVAGVAFTRESVALQLSGASLMRFGAPVEKISRAACPYRFKDPDTCQYSGAGSSCDKTLDGTLGCLSYNNVVNYGGEPGIPSL